MLKEEVTFWGLYLAVPWSRKNKLLQTDFWFLGMSWAWTFKSPRVVVLIVTEAWFHCIIVATWITWFIDIGFCSLPLALQLNMDVHEISPIFKYCLAIPPTCSLGCFTKHFIEKIGYKMVLRQPTILAHDHSNIINYHSNTGGSPRWGSPVIQVVTMT